MNGQETGRPLPELLFLLTAIGLRQQPLQAFRAGEFGSLTIGQWQELMQLASCQGVAYITFDVLMQLDAEGKLAHGNVDDDEAWSTFFFHWMGQLQAQRGRYVRHRKAVLSLAQELWQAGYTMTLLKGYGLSLLYPTADLRPTGDIDLYTSGHAADIDTMMRGKGLEVTHRNPKHSCFEWKHEHVENHYALSPADRHGRPSHAERLFARLCRQGTPEYLDGHLQGLPPLAGVMFLTVHLATHFGGTQGIKVRQVADWALYLQSHATGINRTLWRTCLDELSLVRFHDTFCTVAQRMTCIDMQQFRMEADPDGRTVQLIIDDMLVEKTKYRRGIRHAMPRKALRVFRLRWKYRILPGNFYTNALQRSCEIVREAIPWGKK